MKANENDYRKEIHVIVDQISSLPRLIRLYSYANRMNQIQKEKIEEEEV